MRGFDLCQTARPSDLTRLASEYVLAWEAYEASALRGERFTLPQGSRCYGFAAAFFGIQNAGSEARTSFDT